MKLNSNLVHNVLNVVMALGAAGTAFLIATGCTTLPTGALDCSQSWVPPEWTAIAVSCLALSKTLINIARDGWSGLVKPQPPVDKS